MKFAHELTYAGIFSHPQCMMRVIRFLTELGFVLSPNVMWLQLFVLVSCPTVLVNGWYTLQSCGIEFDELKDFLVSRLLCYRHENRVMY